MKSVQDKLDVLFKKWEDSYGQGSVLCKDGIIDEKIYWKKIPRIVFLLKETHGDFINIAPLPPEYKDGWGPEGSSPHFWPNLRSWQYVLEEIVRQIYFSKNNSNISFKIEEENVNKIIKTPLTGVGYINIKKIVGGSESNWDEIYHYAKKDAMLLNEQLSIINPQIIFCCGFNEKPHYSIYECLKIINSDYTKAQKLSHCIYKLNKTMVIDWWHPSYIAYCSTWKGLNDSNYFNNDILKEIRNMNWLDP